MKAVPDVEHKLLKSDSFLNFSTPRDKVDFATNPFHHQYSGVPSLAQQFIRQLPTTTSISNNFDHKNYGAFQLLEKDTGKPRSEIFANSSKKIDKIRGSRKGHSEKISILNFLNTEIPKRRKLHPSDPLYMSPPNYSKPHSIDNIRRPASPETPGQDLPTAKAMNKLLQPKYMRVIRKRFEKEGSIFANLTERSSCNDKPNTLSHFMNCTPFLERIMPKGSVNGFFVEAERAPFSTDPQTKALAKKNRKKVRDDLFSIRTNLPKILEKSKADEAGRLQEEIDYYKCMVESNPNYLAPKIDAQDIVSVKRGIENFMKQINANPNQTKADLERQKSVMYYYQTIGLTNSRYHMIPFDRNDTASIRRAQEDVYQHFIDEEKREKELLYLNKLIDSNPGYEISRVDETDIDSIQRAIQEIVDQQSKDIHEYEGSFSEPNYSNRDDNGWYEMLSKK